MENFLKRTKGSITVLVTVIMVPVIFFSGFLVDLARIKCYSDQAVMAADNYGESVISQYDNLLKELYGLFAVTQDEEGLAAIEELEEYMHSSFKPNEKTISWEYFQAILGETEYDAFMPYQDAELTFTNTNIEESALSNEPIMTTQIGDFMRFRVAQQLLDNGDELLEALSNVEGTEDNADVIEKKDEVDTQVGKVMEKMKDYYEVLERLHYYPTYLQNINDAAQEAQDGFDDIVDSSSYKIYKDYITHEDEIAEARQRKNDLEEGEHLSAWEETLIEMGDKYDNDSNARRDVLDRKFNAYITAYSNATSNSTVDFESFPTLAQDLQQKATAVKNEITILSGKRSELENVMNDPNVTPELREGIKQDLATIDELTSGDYSGDNYINLAQCIANNIPQNDTFSQEALDNTLDMKDIKNEYLDCKNEITAFPPFLHIDQYIDFQDETGFENLYLSLCGTFQGNGDDDYARRKKKEAEKQQEETEKTLTQDEKTSARNIPASIPIGDNKKGGGFGVSDLIKTAKNYFSANGFQKGNKLLLKFYTVAYDFGMFSTRITNIEDGKELEGDQRRVSLTGIEMDKCVNYLYGAELEYIFGGHKSSVDNLNATKNKILAFRAINNMTATYTVKEVDKPIRAIAEAAAAINPALGLAAAAALRGAVTLIETAGDWDELTKGNKVVLIKSQLKDLTSYDKFKGLISGDASAGAGTGSEKLKFDYDQYLLIMITFLTTSDQVADRTADLITLNMNTVKSELGPDDSLSDISKFSMEKAYTAVDATCAVHLDFTVMPKGFAQKTLDEDTFSEVEDFEKNTYKFTVTRGY